jgi:hypothetical protein
VRAMPGSAWGAAVTFFPRLNFSGRRRREMGAAAGGDAPCGAEYDAEDEGAQGTRVRESHGMRERPIPLGDLRQSHVAGCLCRPAAENVGILRIDRSSKSARWRFDSRETSGPPAEACLGSPPRRARARAVAAAPSGKRPKSVHHGEGTRSRRLDRQGAPRVEPSLAARRRRVSPPPRYRVFISDLPRDRAAARPSFPLPPSIPSADLARVAPLASRSRRSSSASRWRSPSWSPSAATSRSCWWRRATCSR